MKKLIDGLSLEQWIEKETEERITTFWGSECITKPVIHPKIFGNGKQLCYLGTIDQRPDYWLIRVSSTLDLDADNFDFEKHFLIPLEEEFGRHPDFVIDKEEFDERKENNDDTVEDWDTFEDYESSCEYPHIWWNGGHWGTIVNFGDNRNKK